MYFFSLTSAGSLFVLILSDFIIATEISWQGLFKTSVFQSSFQYLLQLTLLVGNNKKTHISSGFQSLWNWKHCQGPSLVVDNTCLSSPWSLRGAEQLLVLLPSAELPCLQLGANTVALQQSSYVKLFPSWAKREDRLSFPPGHEDVICIFTWGPT